MTLTIKVYLCDDHAVLREGMRNLLQAEPDIDVIGEADNGKDAVEGIRNLDPDVVIMDVNLPQMGGIEAIEQIRNFTPDIRIVVLTMFSHEEYLFRAIKAGAQAYLLKDEPIRTVIDAIHQVMDGQSVLAPELTSKLFSTYRGDKPESGERLSPRELEVLTLLVDGCTNKEIAERLFITETTVKLHVSNILRKLNVRSRSQAILRAVREKLVNV